MTDHEMPGTGFLEVPATTDEVQRIYDADVERMGFVMNLSRLWAHRPAAKESLFAMMDDAAHATGLSPRQIGIVITACASTLGDSYCSLAWGGKLTKAAGGDADIATGVLTGDDERLDPSERALAAWARDVARDPSGTTPTDVESLRDAGFDDDQIFAITLFVALRIAFSTVNAALGASPDGELIDRAPSTVVDAVTWGRAVVTG